MDRFRRIPTAMRSGKHLVLALQASGLRQVERFDEPRPLVSWRNQPMAALAEIVVRRQQIGATADDLGFTRGRDGYFEALVSEILLARFDLRWWRELEQRYAALLAADGGVEEAPPLSATPSSTPARAPSPAPPARAERRPEPEASARAAAWATATDAGEFSVERELAAVLGAAARAGRMRGCVPLALLWAFLALIAIVSHSTTLFLFATLGASVLAFRAAKQRVERMADAAAAEFRSRFRDHADLRAAALLRLRRELATLPPERKTVVELLLQRLGR